MTSTIGLRHIDDKGVVVTDGGSWYYARLPLFSYDLLSDDARVDLVHMLSRPFAALRDAECHLLVVPREYSTDQWVAELRQIDAERSDAEWNRYLGAVADHVGQLSITCREVFLGVRLGRRPTRRSARSMETVERALGLRRPGAPERDLSWAHAQAEQVHRTLRAAGLRVRPAKVSELSWLVQRAFWRGIDEAPPVPAVDDGAELEMLAEGTIRNRRHALTLEQPTGSSVVASLAFSSFPDDLAFPGGEWLYLFESMPFPVEASVRFRIVPPREAAHDVGEKLAAARDQARHIHKTSSSMPLALVESARAAEQLEHEVTKEGLPLVYGWPRLTVWGSDDEELERRISELRIRYEDLDIKLARPTGDQLSLFLEGLPGQRRRVDAYEQWQPLRTLAGSMFAATSQLGDGIGPYIGQTSGRSRSPVHFDPMLAARGGKEGTLIPITGRPGGGKSNTAMLLLYQSVLRGVTCVLVDPKGDATGLAQLLGPDRVHHVEFSSAYAGALDPFLFMSNIEDAVSIAVDMLLLFLPRNMAVEHESTVLRACKATAAESKPTLMGVVRELQASTDEVVKKVGQTLADIADSRLAKLCFGEARQEPIVPEGKLTVFEFPGLALPETELAADEYGFDDRIATGLMYAVTSFSHRVMDGSPPSVPKMIVLDEAWAITGSRQGRKLVRRIARTGRSKNTVLGLVTQNVGDLLDQTVTDTIATAFCFRARDEDEVRAQLRMLRLEETPEHVALVRNLRNGECIMSDLDGRLGTVKVDLAFDEIARAFDTTPGKRLVDLPVEEGRINGNTPRTTTASSG